MSVTVRPVASKADKAAFIDLAYRLNADDPNWIASRAAKAAAIGTRMEDR